MEPEVVELKYTTITGAEITPALIRQYCALPEVYIAHPFGHIRGKLMLQPFKSFDKQILYRMVLGISALVEFKHKEIKEIVLNPDGSLYYIQIGV